jgi:hypothetical protein
VGEGSELLPEGEVLEHEVGVRSEAAEQHEKQADHGPQKPPLPFEKDQQF